MLTGFLQWLDEYLKSGSDWARCSYIFLDSPMFNSDKDYVRLRLIEELRKEDLNPRIYLVSTILLFDGRQNQETFEVMQAEGSFPRLLELLCSKNTPEDKECRNRLLDLLYEMSRVQKLRWEDLGRWPLHSFAWDRDRVCLTRWLIEVGIEQRP